MSGQSFGQVCKGTRLRHRVVLPLGDAPIPPPVFGPDGELVLPPPSDGLVPLDLRPLTSGEQTDVLAKARAHAISKGVTDPQDGNPIYDLAEMEHTLLLACLVADSPDAAARPFFSSLDEIRSSPDLGRDRIAYLFELHQQFQDEISPRLRTLSTDDFIAGMLALAGESEADARRFFESLGPGLRWIFMRSLARQCMSSPTPRSPSGSPSASSGDGSKPSASSPSVGNRAERRALQAKKGKRR